jgi:hypothetical protein
VYGAIAYYLANQKKVDKYLVESEIRFEKEAEQRREELKRTSPELYKRLKQKRVIAR